MVTCRSAGLVRLLANVAVAASIGLAAGHAYAQAARAEQADLADCSADDPTRAIKGCSAVLARGSLVTASIRKTVLTYRAMAYLDQEDFTHALTDADALVHLAPGEGPLKSLRGRALAGLGRNEEAIADFSAAIQADPKDIDDVIRRGKSAAAIGDRKMALADFEAAARARFNQPQPFLELGRFQFDSGDYQAALDSFRHAVANGPNNALAYYWRGRAFEKESNSDKAADDFDAATHINPKLWAAWLERGTLYERAGDIERARECYQHAASGPSGDPDVIAALAKLGPVNPPTQIEASLQPEKPSDPPSKPVQVDPQPKPADPKPAIAEVVPKPAVEPAKADYGPIPPLIARAHRL